MIDLSKTIPCKQLIDNRWCETCRTLINESELAIHIGIAPSGNNYTKFYRVVCTPDNISELVTGRLISDGIISSVNNIISIKIDESDDTFDAWVTIRSVKGLPFKGLLDVPTTGSAYSEADGMRPISYTATWDTSMILQLSESLSKHRLHKNTYSAHSCAVMYNKEIVYAVEDIGRHNAFDKAIGWILRSNIPIRDCIFFSSGRLPVDMVSKAITSGVSVLASKSAPTYSAVKLACKYNLTLLQCSPKGGMVQYC